MHITVEPGEETPEVRRFIDLVWPPDWPEAKAIAHLVWESNYDRRILTRDESGRIVSQVALVVRDAQWNAGPIRLGGIAGVGTIPDFRARGLASAGLKRAAEILANEGFDCGALFCAPRMSPFYRQRGWQPFTGSVFIDQPGAKHIPFSDLMTLSIKRDITKGEIDVAGLPW